MVTRNRVLSGLPPGIQRPSVLATLQWVRDPAGATRACIERYGDPYTFTLGGGFGTVVTTAHPDGIREIFTADPETFDSNLEGGVGPLLGENSIFLAYGTPHKRQRALLTPPFHGDRIQTYGRLIEDVALRHAARWDSGATFSMYQATLSMSLEVIVRAVFGVQDPVRVEQFERSILAYTRAYSPLLAYFSVLRRQFAGLGPWSHFLRARARLERLLAEEIGVRRRKRHSADDILSLLVAARREDGSAMTDRELLDELKSLLFAGHETVAIALAWAFYWIHRQPQIQQRLLAELESAGAGAQGVIRLPYLDAVCLEALRLYAPVSGVGRGLRRPFTLRGYTLPAGIGVYPSIMGVHLDPTLYPEPRQFRPERFIERKYTPFEYLPFGGGARRCIGAVFANYEMKIVLGTILSRYTLKVANPAETLKPVVRTFTNAPSREIRMMKVGIREPVS